MENTEKKSIVDIFKAAGNGAKAYSLRLGPLTYMGHRGDGDDVSLLFLSGGKTVEFDAIGCRKGSDEPDLFPYEETCGKLTEWVVLANLLAFQDGILSEPVADYPALRRYLSRYAFYVNWARVRSITYPNTLEGRLMGRFIKDFEKRAEELVSSIPAPEKKPKLLRRRQADGENA